MIGLSKINYYSKPLIKKGKAYKDTDSIVFTDREEAEDWGIRFFGHSNYDLLQLGGGDSNYKDEASNRYKTRKRIIKRVKILKIL
tara:strand:+ start:2662 stop:2916 length:255 start_codon:yes stop_codon:yes gene_type:complete